jgi:hypothetical protein
MISLALLLPAMALAQESAAEVALARREFDQCVAALESDRADEAVRHCRSSLEIHGNAPAAYNLGLALKRLRRPNEARQTFEALLEGRYGPLDSARESEVRAQLAAVRAQLVSIVVTVRGGEGTISIGGDTRSVSQGGEVAFDDLDPGTHDVVLEAGAHIERRAVEVTEGRERVTFVVPAPIAATPSIEEESSWVLPAVLIGGGALLVAGGVVLAIVLLSGGEENARLTDDAFSVTFALE